MEKIILLKLGEIVLKGLNRKKFEDRLINNIRGVLKGEGYTYKNAQSTIYIFPKEKFDFDNAIEKLKKVFGIVSIVIAHELPKDMNKICEAAPILLKDLLKDAKTFKCESKRSDKSFELKSPEINLKLGEVILNEDKTEEIGISLEKYIKEYPKLAAGYINIAPIYSDLGDFENALKALNKAESLAKTSDELYLIEYNRAILHYNKHDFASAMTYATKARGIKQTSEVEELLNEIKKLIAIP